MPRVQSVVLPVLREALPDVQVTSWVPQADNRIFPILNIRRIGGVAVDPTRMDRAVIEMTAYTKGGIEAAEDLYLDARQVLWDMVEKQTLVPEVGYLHSFFETMGMTQFDSSFEDTWRVQGLIQLAIRPIRTM
jgi:hypothetical protein